MISYENLLHICININILIDFSIICIHFLNIFYFICIIIIVFVFLKDKFLTNEKYKNTLRTK